MIQSGRDDRKVCPTGREARLWTPLTWSPEQGNDDARHSNNWDMVARLKPAVTVAAAQQRIDGFNRHSVENWISLPGHISAAGVIRPNDWSGPSRE